MAILTVGTGHIYTTIMAAHTAAVAGDIIEVYSNQANNYVMSQYYELLLIDKDITIRAIDKVLISYPLGDVSVSGPCNVVFENMSFEYSRVRFLSTQPQNYTWKNCSFIGISSAPQTFRTDTTSTFINCIFNMSYNSAITNTSGTTNLYNCSIISSGNQTSEVAAIKLVSGIVNVYNCKIYGSAALDYSLGTINDDYNEGVITGLLGVNNVARTIPEMGFTNTTSHRLDLRVDRSFELEGTTIANGVDLTTLFTTDIDGRTRTTYARGCSEGYRVYEAPDYPEEADVFVNVVYAYGTKTGSFSPYTTTENVGELVVPIIEDVRIGVHYDIDKIGILDAATDPEGVLVSYGGRWVPADPAYHLSTDSYGLDGISVTGELVLDFPDPIEVLSSATVGGVQGRWVPAEPLKYLSTDSYGVDGTSIQGRWTRADVLKYEDGETFGEDGISETGTLVFDAPDVENVLSIDTVNGIQGRWIKADKSKYQLNEKFGVDGISEIGTLTSATIDIPTLSIIDNGNGTATATISGSSAGTTNTIVLAKYGILSSSLSWFEDGSRSEDGNVDLTLPSGPWWAYIKSSLDTSCAYSLITMFRVTNAGNIITKQANPRAPKWSVKDVVYLKESALLGFVEGYIISNIKWDPQWNRWLYAAAIKHKGTQPNTVVDAYDLRTREILTLPENDLMDQTEALDLAIVSIEQQIINYQAKRDGLIT
jgi:hypothetical protein